MTLECPSCHEEKATDYAERTAEKLREARDVPVTVVELGEVMAEKLAATSEVEA